MSRPLETAAEIGRRITDTAVWHGGACNWLGAVPESGPESPPSIAYRALPPDLYEGSSGVAIFLAELYAATGEEPARSAGLGALRHALSRAESSAPGMPMGLYAGPVGIALAGLRCGPLLGSDEPGSAGMRLLAEARGSRRPPTGHDLLGGRAGAIVGLLAAYDIVGEEWLLDWARELGEDLAAAAHEANGTASWVNPDVPATQDLVGLSHGAAGPAHALLELHALTGERRFCEVAERAIAYERGLLDPDVGNWPDFRDLGGGWPTSTRNGAFLVAWCHGAPGIGVARAHAYRRLGDERCRAEVEVAVRTTARWVRAAVGARGVNYSLCHGVCGNAEAAWESARRVGDGAGSMRDLAADVCEAGREAYGGRPEAWPCGTHGGETPGLMLGLAGIGLFHLRVHDPEIPSILLVEGREPEPRRRGRSMPMPEPGVEPGRPQGRGF